MAASDLPPFSGDDPTCPNCGNVGAYTTHRLRGTSFKQGREHLERSCRRCNYEWAEATIDNAPALASQQSGEAS
ncbi:hypothetical protein ABZ897_00620 [Nonomuraea sp. NPDC046802]|uniref:hypothetical protein n=1 Tax=Nonomuraea sp. NPDC046802 TaxID=3154919 RepID=UPI00340D05CA